MSKQEKTIARVLSGAADASLSFRDLCQLLRGLNFEERVRGSHHIFSHPDIPEILNLQPRFGRAKPYQVRQIRELILQYGLGGHTRER